MELRDRRANRQGVADQVRTLIRRAHELVEGVTAADFNRRPAGGGWSAAQCLEHLNQTARLYLPAITEAIEQARRKGVRGVAGEGRTLRGRFVAWSQEPPVRLRTRTWPALEPPAHSLDPADVLADFEALHEELIVRINESGTLDRKAVRVPSMLNPRVTLSLGDWFQVLAAHGRRHIWQAGRALE